MTNLQTYINNQIELLERDLESDLSRELLYGIRSALNNATNWMYCQDSDKKFNPAKEFDRVCVSLSTVSFLVQSGGFKMATSRDLEMIMNLCNIQNLPTD